MAGDVALQLLLLLLQAAAGALLQGQGLGQLLHLEAQLSTLLLQALLLRLQLLQLLLGAAAPLAFLGQLRLQLQQPFLLLAQPFAELMLFRLQRPQLGLQFLAAAATNLLLLQPTAGTARHLP
jgi:hypothetical protein